MYPDRDTLSNVPRSGYITARDQSMVKSGVTESGKNTASFFFFFLWMNTSNLNTNTKPQAKKQRFLKSSQKRKQKLVEEKDADNIRKLLSKSFIQWF